MRKLIFKDNGAVEIHQDFGYCAHVVEITSEEVQRIAEEHELRYAIEDVKMHLADLDEGDNVDDDGGYIYDRTKFTPDVVRGLAEEVVDRKGDAATVQEAYWFIVDWVIEDYQKGELTI